MILRSLALAAAILAAAAVHPASAAPRQVLFILDVSGSMAARIDGERKMAVAKRTFLDMLGDLPPGTRIGVEVYGYRGDKDCSVIDLLAPVTEPDLDNIRRKVEALTPRKGATPIAASLELGAEVVSDLPGHKSIVLISDGEETCDGDPVATARKIRAGGTEVTIHVIGFGVNKEQTQQLKAIADAGGGRYFGAGSADELAASFTEVKEQVATAEVDLPPPPEPEIKAEPEPEPEPKGPERVFFDDFEGDALGEGWSVQNPDPSLFLVENSTVLLLNTGGSDPSHAESPNILVLEKEVLPDGDWNVDLTFTGEFKGGNDHLWLAKRKDHETYVAAKLWTRNEVCPDMGLTLQLASGGKTNAVSTYVVGGRGCGSHTERKDIEAATARFASDPARLTLAKRGRSYHAELDLGETDAEGNPKVYVTTSLTALRMPGNLSFAAGKHASASGEVLIQAQSFEVEAAPE